MGDTPIWVGSRVAIHGGAPKRGVGLWEPKRKRGRVVGRNL